MSAHEVSIQQVEQLCRTSKSSHQTLRRNSFIDRESTGKRGQLDSNFFPVGVKICCLILLFPCINDKLLFFYVEFVLNKAIGLHRSLVHSSISICPYSHFIQCITENLTNIIAYSSMLYMYMLSSKYMYKFLLSWLFYSRKITTLKPCIGRRHTWNGRGRWRNYDGTDVLWGRFSRYVKEIGRDSTSRLQ